MHCIVLFLQKEIELEGGFRDDTLALLEGDNSLVKIGTKIRVVGTSERELDFHFLCVLGKFQ